jgi:hypothetical protein
MELYLQSPYFFMAWSLTKYKDNLDVQDVWKVASYFFAYKKQKNDANEWETAFRILYFILCHFMWRNSPPNVHPHCSTVEF